MSTCNNHHHHHHHNGKPAEYPEINYGAGEKWIKSLTQGRLGQFTGGHFSNVNLSSVLFAERHSDPEHVELRVWSAPGRTKPSFEEAMKQEFKLAKKGISLGPSWTNHWWKVRIHIPKDWDHYERVQFEFDPGCEAMVFTTDGTPLQGITGGHGGDRRVDHIIPKGAREKGVYDIIIESSCNGMFGVPMNGDTIQPPDMNRYYSLASADLVVPREEAWRLMWDFDTLRQIADNVPGNSALQNKAIITANAIMNEFNHNDLDSIVRCRKIAEDVFGKGWQEKGADIFKGNVSEVDVWGIGHCHIDTAWLWPFSATQQKIARSWSTQVDLMERYPEHRFAASQAQQYKWLEQLYPKLFDRVKEQIEKDKFHLVGGSWVENDGNMPSGEALVRQFLYGQRFFQSRFGKRCEVSWLPDSFGLSGAYPQIMRSAGMKYFFTQKLSWNNINVFPHSTFNWIGIDGTQVLTHMTPVDTYTAQATVGDIRRAMTNHKNLESSSNSLLVFGNGDGGGGPLNKMLENIRRMRAAADESRDLPIVDMGHSVDEFYRDLEKKTDAGKVLPAWRGELYLEFHRGTYTSHGSIKKGNRKSEILLRDLELAASLASVLHPDKYSYPKEEIDDLWENLLLCQFHDVLPGSAIGMVYDDAEEYYAKIADIGTKLMRKALDALFNVTNDEVNSSSEAEFFAFNPTMYPRLDVIKVPLSSPSFTFKNAIVQGTEDQKHAYVLMQSKHGSGYATACGLLPECRSASAVRTSTGDFVLRNSFVEMTISEGRISSFVDKQLGRELLVKDETGGMVIFEDRPGYWDAWDVEIHHLEKRTPLQFSDVAVIATGPLRASVSATVKFGQSSANITISLDAITASTTPNSRPFFRFDAEVDWHERHQFLKFELPLEIRSEVATYETQFGFVQRPTHKNTTWDAAKFEVCGLKYADLSEYGYGVAILSESKYGFSCIGNILRISLLRGATAPDAEQDQGYHKFSWAVLPHASHFSQSDVPQAAYLFNSPLHVRTVPVNHIQKITYTKPPFGIRGAPNVVLETIKRGEDDNFGKEGVKEPKTFVLRLYEAFGGHAQAFLRISGMFKVSKAYETNLLEDEGEERAIYRAQENGESGDMEIKLSFRGFEFKTVKLVLA